MKVKHLVYATIFASAPPRYRLPVVSRECLGKLRCAVGPFA